MTFALLVKIQEESAVCVGFWLDVCDGLLIYLIVKYFMKLLSLVKVGYSYMDMTINLSCI